MKKELQQQILSGAIEDQLINDAYETLSDEQKKLYNLQLVTGKKNMAITYLIWFFVGEYQLHMLYLGIFDPAHRRTLRLVGLISMYFIIGLFIIIPLKIYDAFKIPSYMRDAERMRKAKLLYIMIPNDKVETTENVEYMFETKPYGEQNANVEADAEVEETNSEIIDNNEATIVQDHIPQEDEEKSLEDVTKLEEKSTENNQESEEEVKNT